MLYKITRIQPYLPPGFVIVLAAMAFLRVWSVQDVIWDDNAWLLTLYDSGNLSDFLEGGFTELQRPQLGTYLYGLFWFYQHTEYFYVIWHGINTLTALVSPLLLYLLLKRMFPKQHELAVFSAVAFVVFHLDLTLLFASASNYRIGLMLALVSFLFLERAVRDPKGIAVGWLIASICAAVASHSLFIEATVTLEPARWLMLFHLLRSRQTGTNQVWRRATGLWAFFVLAAAPLIIYKLTHKPFGLFEDIYPLNPLFFMEWRSMLSSLAHYLLFYWVVMLEHLDAVTPTSWVLGLTAAAFSYFMFFWRLGTPLLAETRSSLTCQVAADGSATDTISARAFLLFGVAAFLPSFLFFQFIGRPPTSWDFDSSHTAIPQLGYAMIVGWLLTRAYQMSITRDKRDPWMKYFFATLIGAGIFFANANIDQYLQAWKSQSRFWTAFVNRFPAIPENSYFIFDIPRSTLYADLGNIYDLEFQLNLLYATSDKPSPFRQTRAQAANIWFDSISRSPRPRPDIDPSHVKLTIHHRAHRGEETVHTMLSNVIFVHFWKDKLLVNKEIAEHYPWIPYRDWANVPVPSLPPGSAVYPLRYKLRRLS